MCVCVCVHVCVDYVYFFKSYVYILTTRKGIWFGNKIYSILFYTYGGLNEPVCDMCVDLSEPCLLTNALMSKQSSDKSM